VGDLLAFFCANSDRPGTPKLTLATAIARKSGHLAKFLARDYRHPSLADEGVFSPKLTNCLTGRRNDLFPTSGTIID
jgi:hypothetical protein